MSSQGGKWGLKPAHSPFPKHSVHLEKRDLFPIHIKVLPSGQAAYLGHNVHPQRPRWTSSAVGAALPLGPTQVQEGWGWGPGFGLFSLQQGGPVGPAQSPPGFRAEPPPPLSLYSALTPSLWVSPGFCLTTAGPTWPCECLKPSPCPPAPPERGQRLVMPGRLDPLGSLVRGWAGPALL